MGPPSCMRSVVDRNVVMRCTQVYCWRAEWFLIVPLGIAKTKATILHGIPEDNDRTIIIDGTLVKNGDLYVSDNSSSSVKRRYKPFSSSSYRKPLPIICFFYRCTVHFEIYVVHSPTNALFINLVKRFKFTLKYTLLLVYLLISVIYISNYSYFSLI